MFAVLLFFIFITHASCVSVCDSDLCVCWYKNVPTEDFVGENVQCSYTKDILNNNLTLPDIIYSLDLSSNNITTLNHTDLFNSNTLIELFLNNNAIREITGNVFLLPKLKRLNLNNNLLEYIDKETFSGVKNLEYLDLSNNRFSTFSKLTFHRLGNLNEVILDNNAIGPSLEKTSLFDRSGFGLTNKIQSVSISGINLTIIPDNFFSDAYDLRNLTISNNNILDIFEIPFTLEYLDVSGNPIANLYSEDFADLPGLKVLKLNNLLIQKIPEYLFSALHGLKVLAIERNKNLTVFSKYAFGKQVLDDPDDFLLEKLSLRGSSLSSLDNDLEEPLGQLTVLDLQGNPWHCDCNFVWVRRLQISEEFNEHVRCATPEQFYNASVFQLKPKFFTCKKRHIGFALAVFTSCILLTLLSIYIFFCLPKRNARFNFIRNIYAPTTGYSILPIAVSINDETRTT